MREEDQERINTFNKLNTRSHELQAGVKAKKVDTVPPVMKEFAFACCTYDAKPFRTLRRPLVCQIQAELEQYEDASNELMLLDDESVSYPAVLLPTVCIFSVLFTVLLVAQVRFVIGESFYYVGPEEAEDQLQEGKQTAGILACNQIDNGLANCKPDWVILACSLSWSTARDFRYERGAERATAENGNSEKGQYP